MLQALIFDFDGLIIDTEWPDFQAWQETYRHHGVELTMDAWLPSIGTGVNTQVFDPYEHFVSLYTEKMQQAQPSLSSEREDSNQTVSAVSIDAVEEQPLLVIPTREAIHTRSNQRHLELIASQPILPGVKELILEAKRRGLGLAVASSSSRKWVTEHLDRVGLLEHFDAFSCGDEVTHAKPYPDIYVRALKKLDVEAGHAIAFEDSLNGMTAARRAGLFCVVIPNPVTRHLPFEEIDLRLNSMMETSIDELIDHLAKLNA